MTRKDYVALAAALRDTRAPMSTVLAIAKVLRDDNPRFDMERFLTAARWKG